MTDIINPAEMSNEKVYGLFKAAYMKPELDADGDVKLKGPSGFHQIITVDGEKQLLKFMAMFGLNEDRSRQMNPG